MSPLVTHELLESAGDYSSYLKMVRGLCASRETTGDAKFRGEFWVDLMVESFEVAENLLDSINLNEHTLEALRKQEMPLVWLAITEAWCLDSAYSLPIIYKMSELNPNIDMKIILRDEPPRVIDNFLTRGARSIPKIICLDAESLVVLGVWGPRPIELEAKIMLKSGVADKLFGKSDNKDERKAKELVTIIKNWHEKDKAQSVQQEVFTNLLF